MVCSLCKERGKTWEGSDPKCAFPKGVFTTNNWNCATMNRLRQIAEKLNTTMRRDLDCGSIGYLPYSIDELLWRKDVPFKELSQKGIGSGYIVMTWYKDRGKTDFALCINGSGTTPLTIEIAEIAIKMHELSKI